jgi:hypothetical protein
MPHVLRSVPGDQHQRRRGFVHVTASPGNRRPLYLSEVHGVSHVLSRGRFHRRSRHRQIVGSASTRGVDGRAEMATATLKGLISRGAWPEHCRRARNDT